MKDYILEVKNYAKSVSSGDIPACEDIKIVCDKFTSDLGRSKDLDFPYYFDELAAIDICDFVESQYHTKGKWAFKKENINLEPWQIFFLSNIFGWKQKSDRLRRYREVLLMVPRKNGKSLIAAAIGVYMLVADSEYGAEVYSGATTEKQAYEVFTPAKLMIDKNHEMKEELGIDVRASNINVMSDGAKFEPIVGNPPDGSSPSCAIADEVHEHKNDNLIDTMITGMGARDQPLMLYISTAGTDLTSPCYSIQSDCKKVIRGLIDNDRIFPLMYGIDPDDSWEDIDTLKKANPNYGVSIGEDFLKARLQDAKNNARKLSIFKTKHLNVWVGARDAYFNTGKWSDCESEIKLEDYLGREVYLGLDLASRVDVASLNILIPDGDSYISFNRHYLPESALEGNDNYRQWDLEGWLTITEGEIIDFNVIKEDILELVSQFEIQELAYDPFQATMLITELMAEGVPVVEMRPTVLNFSEPMKALDGIIRAGKIKHNGDPLMSWMISNVTAKADAKDNVYPRKERPENKIDGVIALLMALGRHMNKTENNIDFDNLLTVML